MIVLVLWGCLVMNEWDDSWNCQSGRLYDPEASLPWEDDEEVTGDES